VPRGNEPRRINGLEANGREAMEGRMLDTRCLERSGMGMLEALFEKEIHEAMKRRDGHRSGCRRWTPRICRPEH